MKPSNPFQEYTNNAIKNATPAIRNNNPGNLKGWDKNLPKDKNGFDIFSTFEKGFIALQKQVLKDALPDRNHTLNTFVEKFAPASENNSEAYKNFLIANLKNLIPGINKNTSFKTIVDTVGENKIAEIITKQEDIKNYELHKNEIPNITLPKTETILSPKIIPINTKQPIKSTTPKVITPKVTTPKLIKKINNSNNSSTQSNSNELIELITSDVPLGVKINTITNGIQKNLIQEPIANIESWFDENFSDPIKNPDPEVTKAKKQAVIDQIKQVKDKEFAIKKEKEKEEYFKNIPAIKDEDAYDLNKLSFGYRNKNNTTPFKSKGIILQTINPITEDKEKLNYDSKTQQLIALDKTTNKLLFPNSKKDLPKNSAFTVANKYIVTDFEAFKKVKDTKNGTGTWFPSLFDKNGKQITYHVGAALNDNTRYGGLYGGKLLVISEDGKYKQLFVGSVAKLQKDFYNFKNKTNSKEVTVIQLDEGSYNKVHLPWHADGTISKSELESYDAQNNKGGHAFYIKY